MASPSRVRKISRNAWSNGESLSRRQASESCSFGVLGGSGRKSTSEGNLWNKPGTTAACGLRKLRSALDVRKNLPCFLQESFTGACQRKLSVAPIEQLCLQFILQVVNLSAERRLRHVQALGGPTHVQFGGNGHEVSQMAQLHNE